MLKIVIFIIFVLINIGLANIDAYKIKQDKQIKHGLNALIYLALLVPMFYATQNWYLILSLLLVRIPVFNTSLNYFRDKELDYISYNTTSITDKITNWIPDRIGYWIYHSILFTISLILTLL
jgi:hypothetical protein